MTIQVLIAADQERERVVLRYLLEQLKAVEIVGEAGSGQEALAFIQEHNIDLVILDVNGAARAMEAAAAILDLHHPPLLALLGSEAELAVKAFDIGAFDFVLKPMELKRLQKMLERAQERSLEQDHLKLLIQSQLKEKMNLLLDRYLQTEKTYQLLPVRGKGKITLLRQQDIIYCESQARKTAVCTKTGSHLCNFTLNELVDKLNQESFFVPIRPI